jgi:Flp pilus assembly protein TadD
VKRSMLLGMLALALPGAGCATFSNITGARANLTRPAPTPAPAAGTTRAGDADFTTFVAQAESARASGDAETAVKLLSQLVLVSPDDPHILGEYGKALAAANRSDDAIAFLQRAIQLKPGDWTLYSAQGVAYDQKGQYQLAQLSYARALQLKPGEPAVLNNDALSHMQSGDLAGAEILLRQISSKSPGYDRVVRNLALLDALKPAVPPMQVARNSQPVVRTAQNDQPPAQTSRPATTAPADLTFHEQESATPPVVMPHAEQNAVPATSEPPIMNGESDSAAESKPQVTQEPQPPVGQPRELLRGIDALRADPTVVLGPIPKDDLASPPSKSQPAPPKPQPVMPKATAVTAEIHAAEAPTPITGPKVYVQAGSYLSEARARIAAAGLETMDVKIMNGMVKGREVFRVRLGPFTTLAQAKAAFAEAQSLGHSDLIIVRE